MIKITRMFKIALTLMKVSIISVLQYRTQFFSAFFSSGIEIFLYIIFMDSIFGNFNSIEGWSYQQMLVLFGISTITTSLVRCFITPNLQFLTQSIRNGELDFILTKPYDSQFLVSFKNINIFALSQCILGILIIAFSGINIRPVNLLLCIWLIVTGIIIFYSFWFTLLLIVFKVIQIDNAIIAIDNFLTFSRYPLQIYPKVFRIIFVYILPLAFIAHIPAEAILGKINIYIMLVGTGLAIFLFVISRLTWIQAVKFYSSASS